MLKIEYKSKLIEAMWKIRYKITAETIVNGTKNIKIVGELNALFGGTYLKELEDLALLSFSDMKAIAEHLDANKSKWLKFISNKKFNEDFKGAKRNFENFNETYLSRDCKKIFNLYESLKKYEGFDKSYLNVESFTDGGWDKVVWEEYERKQNKYRGIQLNQYLIDELNLMICPYCNRDYINTRQIEEGKKKSYSTGVQLDHFFSKVKYPFFAASLYNLVPSCGTCNNIKSDHQIGVSPFDNIQEFDEPIFEYEEDIGLVMNKNNRDKLLEKNIEVFKLRSCYDLHKDEVDKLVNDIDIYNNTQLEELSRVSGVAVSDLKHSLFGPEILPENYGRNSMSKMRMDVLKQYSVY